MRILHITSKDFGPSNIVGGIATVLLQQVKYENRLTSIQSKIVVYNEDKIDNEYFLYINNNEELIYQWNPDIVIFHGFYYYHHYKIAKKLKKSNIKYYIKPHSSFSIASQNKSKFKKKLARKLLLDNYVKNANGCIYLNKEEEAQSIYNTRKVSIMPNGIEKPEIELQRKKIQNLEFVYLGRIDLFHKGLDVLLDCLEKNQEELHKKQIKFIFYGYGRESELNFFLEKISSISCIAEYRGEVNSDNKYKVLQSHDIFVLLSRLEGMPMAILESLICGIPCLITKETNFEYEILQGNCGWVTKLDSNSIIESIREIYDLYNNQELELNYFNRCRNLVKKYYWENLSLELEAEYLNL